MPPETIRVLIVDDITETRESIKRMLQFDKTIEVVGAARTGREAIDATQKQKPDVILMDINMPDMDGITATEAIRRKLPYVQVIILSVQNDPDYMRRAMRVGAHDFLSKPPTIDELTATIRRAGEVAAQERQRIAQETARDTAGFAAGLSQQGKIIVVYSPKGGSGCTTIAANLAITIQLQNKDWKICLIDANLQFGDIPVFLKEQAKYNILELTSRVDELDEDVVQEIMTKSAATGLHILPAPPRPEMAENITGEQFRKLLTFLRGMYQTIIIDTSSYLSETTLTAIELADLIVLITTQEIPAIKNSNAFLVLSDALGYSRNRIVFIMNRYDKRIVSVTPERISENLRQPILITIPFDDKNIVTESINRGVPLIPNYKAHPVAKSIVALSNLIRDKVISMDKPKEKIY